MTRSSRSGPTATRPGIGPALRVIYRRLHRAFGPQHWWPADSPLEVIVGAVLTQNTAWTNVERAIANLKRGRLLSLKRLAGLPPARLAALIRPAGFFNLKAKRLRSVLTRITARGGIAGLSRLPTARLRLELLACHGVGPETADSVLLYAFERPVFVVDAYTRRILSRYGLARGDEDYEDIQRLFQENLPACVRLYNEYHALLVQLAKTHCRTAAICRGCPLA